MLKISISTGVGLRYFILVYVHLNKLLDYLLILMINVLNNLMLNNLVTFSTLQTSPSSFPPTILNPQVPEELELKHESHVNL